MRLALVRPGEAPQGKAEAGAEDPTREAGTVIEMSRAFKRRDASATFLPDGRVFQGSGVKAGERITQSYWF